MKPLEQELNRIKSELADIGCKTMFGKTCKELVQEIIANVVKSTNAQDTSEVDRIGLSPTGGVNERNCL